MRVAGAGSVGAPVEAVWAMLRDPDALSRAIPGCERLDVTGPGRCRVTASTAIAAVGGTYSGAAEIRERREPSLITANVSAAGGRGSVRADVTVRLEPAAGGATEVGYEIDAVVDGAIAGVGQRVLASVAKRLAGEFVGALTAAAAGAAAGLAGDQPRDRTGQAGLAHPDEAGIERARARAGGGIGPRGDSAAGPRPAGARSAAGTWPGPAEVRARVLAGAAAGLAGIVIGAVLGRRGRRGRRGRPARGSR